ncbi:MAG: 3-hydroxyacyl-CoA dehydrogenase [Rhodospirillales bacterium]
MTDPVTARSSPVALVGAGSMGIGWAIVFARAGHPVALHDADPAALDRVPAALAARLDGLAAFGLLDEAPAVVAARVRVASGLADALDGAVHVQENVLERRDVKAPLFAQMDRLARPDAVLASSSSAIPVSEIAGDLPGRARCLVAHPANPPFLLPVVELVPAPFTAADAVARTRALMEGAGQSPVVLGREIEGFVFNRLQGAVLREAYCLVRDGVASVADIDRVMTDGLGLRWSVIGPFETSDLNYRGGLREHARRMGAAYARMGASRGQDDPWTDDLVATADDQRRALVPLDRWEARVAWRDRALMAQAAHRRRAPGPADPG